MTHEHDGRPLDQGERREAAMTEESEHWRNESHQYQEMIADDEDEYYFAYTSGGPVSVIVTGISGSAGGTLDMAMEHLDQPDGRPFSIQGGSLLVFAPVPDTTFRDHCTLAALHGATHARQLVWQDSDNLWPWDDGHAATVRGSMPILAGDDWRPLERPTNDPHDPYCPGCERFATDVAELDLSIIAKRPSLLARRDLLAAFEIGSYLTLEDETSQRSTLADRALYVTLEEGTYNQDNGHFLCDRCYVEAGMPSLLFPDRWVCP